MQGKQRKKEDNRYWIVRPITIRNKETEDIWELSYSVLAFVPRKNKPHQFSYFIPALRTHHNPYKKNRASTNMNPITLTQKYLHSAVVLEWKPNKK